MTRLFAIALLALSAASATTVVVGENEDLPAVAQRSLGSAAAAPELQILNHLSSASVAPGTRLNLPGPDRGAAVKAIASAHNAVNQATSDEPAREKAAQKLRKAEELLRSTHYSQAAAEADSAWQLVAHAAPASSFAVEVADSGRTRVRVKHGEPVRVEAEGKVRAVREGERVDVAKGQAPGAPEADLESLLRPPELIKPLQGAKVPVDTDAQGRASVRLTWHAVDGAVAYYVEATPSHGGASVMVRVKRPEASLPSLIPGSYRWRVVALSADGAEVSSRERNFDLVENPSLKLEAQETPWQ